MQKVDTHIRVGYWAWKWKPGNRRSKGDSCACTSKLFWESRLEFCGVLSRCFSTQNSVFVLRWPILDHIAIKSCTYAWDKSNHFDRHASWILVAEIDLMCQPCFGVHDCSFFCQGPQHGVLQLYFGINILYYRIVSCYPSQNLCWSRQTNFTAFRSVTCNTIISAHGQSWVV